MQKRNTGFTLVELIVVITILAILGTIAIMAFGGYSKNARDSARISDISKIISSVELFQVEKGFLPEPTGGLNVTYSGATAWTQGTFGDQTVTNVQKLDKKPVDPLTQNEYTYSVTNSKKEFQLGAVYEGDGVASIVSQTYAAENKQALVKGNYNGSILKVQTGATTYILAIPSIIASDIETSTDVEEIVTNRRLVFEKHNNLPSSYKNSGYTLTGGFDFNPGNSDRSIVVFEGNINDLKNEPTQLAFLENLQAVYGGTIIESTPEVTNILSKDIATNEEGSLFTAQVILNENVTNDVKVTATNNNNAGGNTGGGGGASAGNYNLTYFSKDTIPMNSWDGYDEDWASLEVAPGKVMIFDGEGFGFFNVDSTGQITHLFSTPISSVTNIPSDWTSLSNSSHQHDNILNLGSGKIAIISREVYGSSTYTGYGTRIHLFEINVGTQSITYHSTYDLKPYEVPVSFSQWDYYEPYLGAFIDDSNNIRVAYRKIVTYENGNSVDDEIWMQKISVSGNTLVSSEDQKILDLTTAEPLGFTSNDYVNIKTIDVSKVSNNKAIIILNTVVYNLGVDGLRNTGDETKLENYALSAFGVNFSNPGYVMGGVSKIVEQTLGADWPIYPISVGGDRVAITSVGYRSGYDNTRFDEEPYVVVTKLNQSTLEITSGNPVLLAGDNVEGWYKMGITKINDNKILVAGERSQHYAYGSNIPNGIFPGDNYSTYVVNTISEITLPYTGCCQEYVFETTTGNSYKFSPDKSELNSISVFEDTGNDRVKINGGGIWEVDLGVGNVTPISVNEIMSGHLGNHTDGINKILEMTRVRLLGLSTGQIYIMSNYEKTDGTITDGQFNMIAYPHIILTPQ